MTGNIAKIAAAIDYIEDHLEEKPDLAAVAKALHYSKYHLHRMFTATAGLTIHAYTQRRRLTEAARLLVFSDRPILEIALAAGYGSQQAFGDIFRAMYKKAPGQYREAAEFYPLQLRFVLNGNLGNWEGANWRERIAPAAPEDIPKWLELVRLVVDGFPCLDEALYRERLGEYIRNKQALILRDADAAIGAMAFDEAAGSIDFLGVHPQYRRRGIGRAFCEKALYELARTAWISTTTFREGDRADTGYRAAWRRLGFAEGELLVEFGYPTQRFLRRNNGGQADE